MKKPQRTTKPPRTPRIKADHHKDDLRVLATSSPGKLARAVVQGFGFRKGKGKPARLFPTAYPAHRHWPSGYLRI